MKIYYFSVDVDIHSNDTVYTPFLIVVLFLHGLTIAHIAFKIYQPISAS